MTTSRYKTILLFGGPGSGKGTQGHVLGALPGFVHVSSGDIFRSLSPQSTVGQEFRSYSSKGLLVPDELTVRLWLRYMNGLECLERFVPEYHVLVSDGIPRTTQQAELLAEHLDVRKVLYFDMDEKALVERLQGRALKENRADDANETVIRKRIQIYKESTRPVLEKYDRKLVVTIDAGRTPIEVSHAVFQHVREVEPKMV
jgi:adenylate kinase